MAFFVFRLKILVLDIFQKFLRDVVAEYKEIIPHRFQVHTTISDS